MKIVGRETREGLKKVVTTQIERKVKETTNRQTERKLLNMNEKR